jgi:hypothetical protein
VQKLRQEPRFGGVHEAAGSGLMGVTRHTDNTRDDRGIAAVVASEVLHSDRARFGSGLTRREETAGAHTHITTCHLYGSRE